MKEISIKKKIMIWFTAALFVMTLGTSGFTLYISKNVLNQSTQERLMNIVRSNADEIEFYNSFSCNEKDLSGTFLSYNGGLLEIDGDFCGYYDGIYTALVDSDNSLLYGETPFALADEKAFSFTSVGSVTHNGEKYYIYEKKLSGGSMDGLWLRGFVSESENLYILSSVVKTFLLIAPLFAVGALAVGYAITRRSFLPIEKINDAVADISRSGELTRRIALEGGKDEIHSLADNFDIMFEKLENNFNAEKQFTSDASHELRTPISVIQAQCEYALDFADSEEEYKDALKVIRRQSENISSLLSQLLFFTRLEQGTEKYRFSEADLSELTRSACGDRKILLSESQALDTDIDDDITVYGNGSLISTLIGNLLDNAFKYSGDKARVSVSLKDDGSQIRLSVRDNGIGISPENTDKIWNRFYREDDSRSCEESFGLGLAMVGQIAKLHDCKISVESEKGKGSTFTILFPKKNF